MNTQQSIVILSAESSNLDRYSNHERTSKLRSRLLEMGLPFDGVTGVYKGTKEVAFLVVTNDVDKMKKLAKEFNQEAILSSDANRMSVLHSVNKDVAIELGKMRQITSDDAKLLDNYTIVNDNGREYFFATSKQV